MDELEDPDNIPLPSAGISINLFPPKDEIVTDKDSGEEDNTPRIKKKQEAINGKRLTFKTIFSPWPDVQNNYNETKNPVELFYKFTDDKIVDLAAETNNYANRKNLKGDVCHDEIKTFIGVMLLRGYVPDARRKLY
ncbi:hypothetical protein ILUMI_26224 [Ignelater luminosus]|uniref:PiggyBac transposable element-derived protein domain-containing protein n=1 Tax=Ignelater luminosus TaxID=2038154 RepID=A0A8K0C708_IGNLU|nr:hypothetical protein ILUMI_26224 [Ignelater luminosus]